MTVVAVGVDQRGSMEIPPDPQIAGWYRFGPTPGDRAGATVLAAHIDSAELGTGPMARLGDLRPGDEVVVTSGGTTVYAVTSVLRLGKGELDTEAVFDRAGARRLHLVTCGGAFDTATGHYEDNIVVVAAPVAPRS